MSRIRSTAMPALVIALSVGLAAGTLPAQAGAAPPAAKTAVSTIAQHPSAKKAKPRISPPARVTVHEFEQGKVTISWSRVRGATRYQVHAYKTDPKSKFIYPFNIVAGSEYLVGTRREAYTFVNNFTPQKDATRLLALPWRITVATLSPNRNRLRDSSPKAPTLEIRDKTTVKVVYITKKATAKQKRGWKATVGKCAAAGLGAGVGVVGTAGIVAVAATWIPGVGEVTWAAVAAEAAATAVTTAVVCVAVDKITGELHPVSV